VRPITREKVVSKSAVVRAVAAYLFVVYVACESVMSSSAQPSEISMFTSLSSVLPSVQSKLKGDRRKAVGYPRVNMVVKWLVIVQSEESYCDAFLVGEDSCTNSLRDGLDVGALEG
jgi:hypothetical protein